MQQLMLTMGHGVDDESQFYHIHIRLSYFRAVASYGN